MKKAMMQQPLHLLCAGLVAMGMTGCVDHDYDLSDDIDMTMQFGGESLTIPTSSTDLISLSQILNLEEGSSIKTATYDGEYGLKKGDYVLTQEGGSTPSQFDVPEVNIENISGSTSYTEIPEFINIGVIGTITQEVQPDPTKIHLQEDNVPSELVAIESADLDVEIVFEIGFESDNFTGKVYLDRGYSMIFDPSWTIVVKDPATAQIIESVDEHTVRLKDNYLVTPTHSLTAKFDLVKMDLTKLPEGQGLYAPGHFLVDSEIATKGDVTLDMTGVPVGEKANITLKTISNVTHARILKVRGIVDPKIEISETSFDINDIPDFLSDPANRLDIDNPQIYFTVSNTSPLAIELNGQLTSYKDGKEIKTVGIGAANGTAKVVVEANTTTKFAVCQRATNTDATDIVVPDLGQLIETIPDRISFHDATCKSEGKVAEYTLGTTYHYNCDYEAIIPLAFGENMNLHYTHEEKDWDVDLDKFNFNTVLVSIDVENALPLDMTPSVVALDREGNDATTITATVDGTVKAGTMTNPATSTLEITLRSTGKNINDLDGVRLIFDASSNKESAGINLNDQQSLKFAKISITVKGGVLIDLND